MAVPLRCSRGVLRRRVDELAPSMTVSPHTRRPKRRLLLVVAFLTLALDPVPQPAADDERRERDNLGVC